MIDKINYLIDLTQSLLLLYLLLRKPREGEKPYTSVQCAGCGQIFNNTGTLEGHLRNRHPELLATVYPPPIDRYYIK